ncbi:sensor histidine kinase [Paenibacillus sp. JDR-2]|uniref:sensor histidine kinase n=1 Tax=Paenibacillus sp. (strain JDR-2) TaxID=324057 RepID=UPI0001666CF3|nr:sensor histidine kinase [Paenibacillus sp. JDR-2]ACT01201.1 putative sensor with HAMP domain [Paenibacillus sp. JDR-2]
MRKLFDLYRNMYIRKKITIVFIPIVVLPLLVIVFTSNSIFSDSTLQKTKVNIKGETSVISARMDNIYSNGETCSSILVKDINRIYQDLGIGEQNTYQNVRFQNQILNEFDFNLRAFKDIESIAYMDSMNNLYVSDYRLNANMDKAMRSRMLESLKAPGIPTSVWFPMQTRDYLTTDPNSPVLTIGKRVVDIESGETLGIIILNIRESTFSSIFPMEGIKGEDGFNIVDANGRVVSSTDKDALLQPVPNANLLNWLQTGNDGESKYVHLGNGDYLIVKKEIPELGWTLYKQMMVKELTIDTYTNSFTIFVVGLLCTIIAIISSIVLSRHIAKPIIKLTRVAKLVREGNLNTASEVKSQDEVGILAGTFNEMIVTINGLLNKVTQEQRKKREYEFALIQAQIKPHFFYNTLDLIYVLCEKGKTSLAADTTMALADFYRISLSKGKEIITIAEELKVAEDYLFIQKTRYSDIIDFTIDVDPAILEYTIIKLTIQPLIENAIYHGLRPKMTPGKITIKGFWDRQGIILQVIDDGIGFPTEEWQANIDPAAQPIPAGKSFGLKSVHERIQLYFGERYGIQVESGMSRGTKVTITIPPVEGGLST